jgi:radical SAM superfamily enzyme YgiQ (UPF0313 family)
VDRYKALLINPWIYDFAAYNFWCRPVGLLKLAEALSRCNVEIHLIDTLQPYRQRWFSTGKFPKTVLPSPEPLRTIKRRYGRYGISEEDFVQKLKAVGRPDVVFVTTMMTYWYPGPRRVVELVREYYPGVPVVVGGVYATLCPEHAKATLKPDILHRGPLTEEFFLVLKELLPGLKETGQGPLRHYQMGLYRGSAYEAVLTSEGCPFRCTYCGSSILTGGRFSQLDPEDVVREILDLWAVGVQDFAFYDDALLFRAETHIKPILRQLLRRKDFQGRFHTPNGLHARMLDEELAWLMKQSGFRTIRLSLETVEPERQKNTGGKVTSNEVERAVRYVKKAGVMPGDIGVYIMFGLPGQDIEEVRESVRFVMGLGVRVHLAEFSPVPGTREYQKLVDSGVIPEDLDPLLTNNTVFSLLFAGYKEEHIRALKDEVLRYNRSLLGK